MGQDIQSLLKRLLLEPGVPGKLRSQIIEILLGNKIAGAQLSLVASGEPGVQLMDGTSNSLRKLVYVHGICKHDEGYSNDWWESLRPHLDGTFGEGVLNDSRSEVLWSDLVNPAFAGMARGEPVADSRIAEPFGDSPRGQIVNDIIESLHDRVDHQSMQIVRQFDNLKEVGVRQSSGAIRAISGMTDIPGLNCLDDFAVYLVDDEIRRAVIGKFTSVLGPMLQDGVEVDLICHSWGTVVAYEGLCELADTIQSDGVVRNFFTVGAALSIGPVKSRLLRANRDGHKPRHVQRWINVNARGDIVGGPLKGRPYEVDLDFVDIDPEGCWEIFGLVNPKCAHGSYFVYDNFAVNRDIFARYINS